MLDGIVRELDTIDRVRALLLVGSLGRGAGDPFSDLDLLALMAEDEVAAVAQNWPRLRGRIAPLVKADRFDFGSTVLFHQITEDWVRYDLTLAPPAALDRQARDSCVVLFDRDGLTRSLPATRPVQHSSAEVAERIVPEFYRVLALTPVVLGRDDLVSAASGSSLLRGMLIDLARELVEVPDRGGALSLRRLLPAESYRAIAELPPIEADRAAVLRFQQECSRLFTPWARELCERTGADFPLAFARAVAKRTEPLLGGWWKE